MSIKQDKFRVTFTVREKYVEKTFQMSLNKKWATNRKTISKDVKLKLKEKGIYIFFTNAVSNNIIYVGKTRGPTMDFATRLYRHATKSASGNSKVYRELLNEQGPVYVHLLNINEVKRHFEPNIEGLSESAMIDILEQSLIHYLEPRLQD